MAIVNRIISDHNASIRVEDNVPSGARFIIELPTLAREAGKLASAVEVRA